MTDRPIIFSAPMVRALIDGRKTQTRRVLKPQPPEWVSAMTHEGGNEWIGAGDGHGTILRTPYAPGDRLWVREAWNQSGLAFPVPRPGMGRMHYRADPDHGWKDYWGAWRSPIHMPRWASRLTLTVTDVTVQRLHEISDADAVAEGITPHGGLFLGSGTQADIWMSAINSFHSLWNGIHGPDAWSANPWVCALTFTVDPRNIDVDTAPKDQAG
jgi:hypothetical protein